MTGINPAVVELSGGNLVLVIVVTLIALGALGMAFDVPPARCLPPVKAPTT